MPATSSAWPRIDKGDLNNRSDQFPFTPRLAQDGCLASCVVDSVINQAIRETFNIAFTA